ncbi:MAG: Npt1/Npt2 family nucleotide transporter [Bacteroidales bacterium]
MSLNIARALNIEKSEQSVVILLLTQSVFLGIFAGALDVGANSLFLQVYSADLMPRAFMISGAVGIFFTSGYTYLQKKIPFRTFTVINLLIVILLTAVLRMGYSYTDDPRVTFALLVFMGPLIIISMLGFWGTAGRYFTLREGKRLFGIIDTGSVVGMILAFYAVPVLVRFNFNVHDTLLIGLASLIIALLFQITVLHKHSILAVPVSAELKRRSSGLLSVFRKRYTSMMALFVIISVIAAFFIHYSFMWATEANYSDTRELTSFLGAFFGTMMIFTVVIKSTLYGWLMKNYGLRITLLISPVLLLILTVIAAVVGGFFGYTAEAASFTMFFLVISLSKLFNKSLKDAIESPSMKILYQSLDSDERFDIQAKIDGVVNEFTAFSAGLIMAGLLFLSFITVIHFSYILVFLLVIWVILGFSLYRSYRKTLNESLAAARSSETEGTTIEKKDSIDISNAGMYSEIVRLDPYFYHHADKDQLNKILEAPDPEKQRIAWEHISGTLYKCDNDLIERILKDTANDEIRMVVSDYSERLRLPGKKIDQAFHSSDKNSILSALIQTVEENDTSQVPNIIALLRDRDMQLRASAIEAAGNLKVKELGGYLVDYLGHPHLYSVDWPAMVNMGEIVLENLENAFHKTGVEMIVRLRIVRAMISIGGPHANRHLFEKITFHQRDVREAAINGLYLNDYLPTEKEILVLKNLIYDAVLAGAINMATEYVIQENDPGNALLEAIREESVKTDHLIFTLLAITYDRSAIGHVQRSFKNIENEDAGFALELLNLIVDDDVYVYLEPYFDDLWVVEKIRRLQNEMPVEIISYGELLLDLLNRDSLYTGNYLRICAIDALKLAEGLEAGQYLAAQVFHPNPVISKTASFVLADKDSGLFHNVMERLDIASGEAEPEPAVKADSDPSEIIRIVEDLQTWMTFRELNREILFNLACRFIAAGNTSAESLDNVTVMKAAFVQESLLKRGVVLNLTDYPGILEQMDYLATHPEFRFYQLDRNDFRELLFDVPEILYACQQLFTSPDAIDFFNFKVKQR